MDYIEDFTHWLMEQGKGQRTIEEYRAALRELIKWYDGSNVNPFHPENVTAYDLHKWIEYMQTVQKLAPSTINKRIAAIKTYWNFLVQTERVKLNPTQPIRVKRVSALWQTPRWLSRKEQAMFLHQVRKDSCCGPSNPLRRTESRPPSKRTSLRRSMCCFNSTLIR